MAIVEISETYLGTYKDKTVKIIPKPVSKQCKVQFEVPDEVIKFRDTQYILNTYAYVKRRFHLIGKTLDWYLSELNISFTIRVLPN